MNSLPIVVLDHIFLQLGQVCDEELIQLRLVCKTWNETIKMKLRGKKPSKEWGRIIASRVKMHLASHAMSAAEITRAASLAHQGHLGSLYRISLQDVNLSYIPAENLASLVSSVERDVDIRNVSGCGLVTILNSVKIEQLHIRRQSLDSEESRALVRAMESRVREVELLEEVTLDITALMEYSGQGKCGQVECYYDSASRYREDFRTLAQNKNWQMIVGGGPRFKIWK